MYRCRLRAYSLSCSLWVSHMSIVDMGPLLLCTYWANTSLSVASVSGLCPITLLSTFRDRASICLIALVLSYWAPWFVFSGYRSLPLLTLSILFYSCSR